MAIVKVRSLSYAMVAAFLFSLHIASTSYGNSTFIENTFGPSAVFPFYSIAAIVIIIALLFFAPKIIRSRGSLLFVGGALLLSAFALTELSHAKASPWYAFIFVAYFALNTLVMYGLDLMVEHATKNTDTGKVRGIYLTVVNLAWMLSLLVAGTIIQNYGFDKLYFLSAIIVLLSLVVIYLGGPTLDAKKAHEIDLFSALKKVYKNKNLTGVYIVNFTLQFFYAIMVIYTPLYLLQVVGFDWQTIGLIFFIMLSPFVIFQYPLGRLADARLGEKELLIGGVACIGLSTIFFGTLTGVSVGLFAGILFCTRVGAATVEVMADSYFFKQIDDSNAGLVSLYRAMSPLALIVASIVGSYMIAVYGYTSLFYLLGVLVLLAIIPALRIHDTK